jgi:uncharacterized membrane protein
MGSWFWLVFVAGTICCWGAYGPTLHRGQMALGKDPWKAILCVGAAYFVLAVIVPVAILKSQGKGFEFTREGTIFASIAGALGALGAMCIAGALKTGGTPITVMPLVFGFAPVVNVVISGLMHRPENPPHPLLYVGILLLGAGAGLVMYFKPQ